MSSRRSPGSDHRSISSRSTPVCRPNPRLDPRVSGDTWQVHGGGFYQIQKYVVAPEFLPAHLTWFKWEAYSTWIFGFALLVTTYYMNPSVYLLDAAVSSIEPWDAVPLALGSLVLGWIGYDQLCRSWIGQNTARLAICGFALLTLITFGFCHVFSGRGAFLQVGALVGSIMVGNVFFIIIPNQTQDRRGADRRARTGRDLGLSGQTAVGAQQLPDVAGRVRHAQQPLLVHVSDALELADPDLRVRVQLSGAALFQHHAHGRRAGLAALARRRDPGHRWRRW